MSQPISAIVTLDSTDTRTALLLAALLHGYDDEQRARTAADILLDEIASQDVDTVTLNVDIDSQGVARIQVTTAPVVDEQPSGDHLAKLSAIAGVASVRTRTERTTGAVIRPDGQPHWFDN